MKTIFHIIYWQEGKFWIAKCLENSIASQGSTPEEAQENLKEALELTYEEENISMNYNISNVSTNTLEFAN